MTLMSLYSAKVPRIRTKKPSSLTITGIENMDDMRSMLVDLSRVSMEKRACRRHQLFIQLAGTIFVNYIHQRERLDRCFQVTCHVTCPVTHYHTTFFNFVFKIIN